MGSTLNPSPEERLAATRSRLAELADKFIERTRGELELMRAALTALRGGDTSAAQEILHLAHRITGTGATLGFDVLSEQARRLEQLAATLSPETPGDAATCEQLGRAIEALAAALESIGR